MSHNAPGLSTSLSTLNSILPLPTELRCVDHKPRGRVANSSPDLVSLPYDRPLATRIPRYSFPRKVCGPNPPGVLRPVIQSFLDFVLTALHTIQRSL